MASFDADKCRAAANGMRRDMLAMAMKAGANGTHIGGSLSAAEILATLYQAYPGSHILLSKGHCAMAQYAAMRQAGQISEKELENFENPDSWLCSHVTMNWEKNIMFSTGSLGQGLSLGLGLALGLARKGQKDRVFVLLGDGECGEGQVWEAAMAAAHFGAVNLTAIVDANGMQLDGMTSEVLNLGDLAAKWQAFGWHAVEADGHDPAALAGALAWLGDSPLVCIARTVKGKGVSFMENSAAWHHGRLGRKQFDLAMAELEGK